MADKVKTDSHNSIAGEQGKVEELAPAGLPSSQSPGEAQQTFHQGERTMLRKRILNRIRHLDVDRLVRRGRERGRKWQQRRRTPHPTTEKQPIFVVGCNRSGTNMIIGAIGNSPHGWDYPESVFSTAFNGYYLREDWIIKQLIRRTPAPIVGFGSILDSQSVDSLLNRFEGAKAIWIYRRYEDVANSCARMQWGSELKNYARWVSRGELEKLGARGKGISADTVRLFGKLYRDDLTDEDAACLYWYLRNHLFFELELYNDPRVLLVQYEDTVLDKEKRFRRIFDFLGFPYDPAIVKDVFASSVSKNRRPDIDPAIREVCDVLTAWLDLQYARTSDWTSEEQEQLPGEPQAVVMEVMPSH